MGFLLYLTFPVFIETLLVPWAHGIENTDTFDVVGYYDLFNSMAVRIPYNQRGYLKSALKKVSRKEH